MQHQIADHNDAVITAAQGHRCELRFNARNAKAYDRLTLFFRSQPRRQETAYLLRVLV